MANAVAAMGGSAATTTRTAGTGAGATGKFWYGVLRGTGMARQPNGSVNGSSAGGGLAAERYAFAVCKLPEQVQPKPAQQQAVMAAGSETGGADGAGSGGGSGGGAPMVKELLRGDLLRQHAMTKNWKMTRVGLRYFDAPTDTSNRSFQRMGEQVTHTKFTNHISVPFLHYGTLYYFYSHALCTPSHYLYCLLAPPPYHPTIPYIVHRRRARLLRGQKRHWQERQEWTA